MKFSQNRKIEESRKFLVIRYKFACPNQQPALAASCSGTANQDFSLCLFVCLFVCFAQAEWELVLNFILAFPSIVKDTVPTIAAKSQSVTIHTNKVNKLFV